MEDPPMFFGPAKSILLAAFLRPYVGSCETKVVVYLDDQRYGQSQRGDVGVVICVLAVRVGKRPVKLLVP
jgi:hypothetical protein